MSFSFGQTLLVPVVFSDGAAAKRRPVMVVYDGGDDDLLVAPVTSQAPRTSYDVVLVQWRQASLRLPSVVRLEKLATVEKSVVLRRLGALQQTDLAPVQAALRRLFATIIPLPI